MGEAVCGPCHAVALFHGLFTACLPAHLQEEAEQAGRGRHMSESAVALDKCLHPACCILRRTLKTLFLSCPYTRALAFITTPFKYSPLWAGSGFTRTLPSISWLNSFHSGPAKSRTECVRKSRIRCFAAWRTLESQFQCTHPSAAASGPTYSCGPARDSWVTDRAELQRAGRERKSL